MVCESQEPHASICSNSTFAQLLDLLLRREGLAVCLSEAYFDESGSHRNSPLLCVAGYAFEKSHALKLDQEWHEVIDPLGLRYFRTSLCAHRSGIFKALSEDQCIEVQTKLIEIINKRMARGIAVTVKPDEYIRIIGALPADENFGTSPYSFCARFCLVGIRRWADETNFNGRLAYIFESGHKSQSEANGIMQRVFREPKLKEAYRYMSHTFADKESASALQSADILAWHWYTDRKRQMNGNNIRRLDAKALLEARPNDYKVMHCDEHTLRWLAVRQKRRDWSDEPIEGFE